MGIDRRDYVGRGWKLPYNRDIILNDKYLPMIEGHRGENFSLISDDMCGTFLFFGEVLTTSGYGDEGWEFKVLPNGKLSNEELVDKYVEIFDKAPDNNPQTMIFSVFS